MGLVVMIYCGMAVKRARNVRSECEEDEGTYCEDGDSASDWERQIEYDILCI
jgi:hypothetical protein